MKWKPPVLGILTIVFLNSCILFNSSVDYKYLIYVPKEKPSSGEYPLLLFLHGRGESGTDLELVKKHGPPSFLNEDSDFPFLDRFLRNVKQWESLNFRRKITVQSEISGVYPNFAVAFDFKPKIQGANAHHGTKK